MPPFRQASTSVLQGNSGAWQACVLTWYDPALGGTNSSHGQADPHAGTASGEPYDPNAFTCAAPPAYTFGTQITFRYNGTEVVCRVNDRGGAIQGSRFDLSRGAATQLGIVSAGRVAASFQVGASPGATDAANAATAAAQSANPAASGSNPNPPGSILDLLTSPVDTIGAWLAGIALNLAKDVAVGFADVVIIPAWHWNQRAVDKYQKDMFTDKTGKQLLFTALFWGGGYWLLFTDPTSGSLAPQPVRNSRIAKHARFVQSLPARQSLVKPKDVKRKTPKKPKEVQSRAGVTQTGTMRATRTQAVKVTGTHARTDTETIEPTESTLPVTEASRTDSEPRPEHRTGARSLPHSRRGAPRDSGTGSNRRSHS